MFIYLNFINCVCLYLTNYNKISQSTIINLHYFNRFSTQICTRLRIRPLRVLQATMRTKLVKGPGGISAPTIRRPWNVMPHTLMHVARRSLNQRELVLVAIGHGRRSPCQLVVTRLARQEQWHENTGPEIGGPNRWVRSCRTWKMRVMVWITLLYLLSKIWSSVRVLSCALIKRYCGFYC